MIVRSYICRFLVVGLSVSTGTALAPLKVQRQNFKGSERHVLGNARHCCDVWSHVDELFLKNVGQHVESNQ